MKNLFDVIRGPWVTEKSSDALMYGNYVALRVKRDSNKKAIKDAVEKIFNVTVVAVKTVCVNGKKKRMGKNIGKRPDWKKAYVKLKEGDKIDLVEGV